MYIDIYIYKLSQKVESKKQMQSKDSDCQTDPP